MLFGISLAMGPGSPTCRGTSWSSASLPMGGPRSVNRSSIGTVLRAADRFGSWFRTSARRRDFQTAFRTRRRGHLQCGVVTGNSAPARQISVRSHCDAMAECGLAPSEPDVPCAPCRPKLALKPETQHKDLGVHSWRVVRARPQPSRRRRWSSSCGTSIRSRTWGPRPNPRATCLSRCVGR